MALASLFALPLLTVLACQLIVLTKAAGKHQDVLSALPTNRVGLVLGTSKFVAKGRHNAYYTQRITAAAKLYKAGKVEYLLVSGDNRTSHYNEPVTMKRDLVAAGVPKEKITCDFAGFRTLDSLVRAKEIFGQSKLTIVSQRFHNERALFLAQASGIDAVAYDAGTGEFPQGKTALRELLARVQAVLDVGVLHTRPKFLGEHIAIGKE
ncbi:ElyC/SanA/YdcF family protein [Armatimonas sp.]|uniref:SanA/YdcF family protein n=1 Tax=Armatimonas sp. TaxID=1872638 RepID=UPI00286D1469|nr:ElyC/SanA/YdcF family protein [Armatimonas sp.]